MKQNWLTTTIALLALALASASFLLVLRQAEAPGLQAPVAPDRATPPEEAFALVSNAVITARSLPVTARQDGVVAEVHVAPGASIQTGDPVLTLADPGLAAGVTAARERRDNLRANLTEADALLATLREEIPRQVAAAEAAVLQAQADLAAQQLRLEKARETARRVSERAEDRLKQNQQAEPAKLRVIIEKDAQLELTGAKLTVVNEQNGVLEAQTTLARRLNELALARSSGQSIEAKAAMIAQLHCQAERAEASLREQEQRLAALHVRSPVNGAITEIRVAADEAVDSGQVIAIIADPSDLVVRVHALAELAPGLVSGDPVAIYLADDERPVTARISHVDRIPLAMPGSVAAITAENTELLSVEIDLDGIDTPAPLAMGMPVKVELAPTAAP